MTTSPETSRSSAHGSNDGASRLLTPGRHLAPLASWRRHHRLGLAAAVAVLLFGAPLVIKMGKPVYTTEAALRIAPSFAKNLQDDEELKLASNTQYLLFVSQQVTTIRSFDVAQAALQRLGPKRSLWQHQGESDRRAAERLMSSIDVHALPNTYLVVVGLSAEKPQGLAEVVNAVTEAYLAKSVEEVFFGTDVRVLSLERQRGELQRDTATHVGELTALAGKLGVSTFKEDALNPLDSSLAATSLALSEWRRQRMAATARLAALEDAQRREASIEVESEARSLLDKNIAVNSAIRLSQDRRDKLMSQMSGLTEGHPGFALMQRQLTDLDTELKHVLDSELQATKSMLMQQRQANAEREWSRAKAEVDQSSASEQKLESEYANAQAQLADYSKDYQAAIDLVHEVSRARKRVEAINNRIDFFAVEQEAPGFVRIASPARPPELPARGGSHKLFLLVLLLAGAGAIGVPLAIDRFDPRLQAPADLEKALGFAPVAWLVERTDKRATTFANDQLQRLALRLEREWRAEGTGCVALSGVRHGAGTTTLTLDLARELATLGLRVLAIETDSLHTDTRYQGTARSPGLSAVLEGGIAPSEAIVAASGQLPDRLPLGYPRGGTHLASVQRLRSLFIDLKAGYDLLLLDVPPVSTRAEAELLVEAADGALLVVAANSVTAAEAQRAARLLEKLNLRMVGTVFNRVASYAHDSTFTGVLREYDSPAVPPAPPLFKLLPRPLRRN